MEAYNFILEERKKLLRARRDGRSHLADSSQNGKSVVHREKRQGCVKKQVPNWYDPTWIYSQSVCGSKTNITYYCKFLEKAKTGKLSNKK
jgi:hypothetical protein